MSIYKEVLGSQFNKLHPMLQKRYEFPIKSPFKANGVMKSISRGPDWLLPLFLIGAKRKFLFPESGTDIPFTIVNTRQKGANGEEQVFWERTFFFPNKTRCFNALMSRNSKSKIVKDYLGEPPLFYSELAFFVSPEGHMQIQSRKQRIVLGPIEVPLPKLLHGVTKVTEGYIEEKGVFTINVQITNPFFGLLFSYEGEFKAHEL
ncbi:DUF4166 domain-containing protein [Planomicrobium sp. CPCC 101110]|uniref:DUF4166 domain-containing protein n=1 Tax=Planomicrobium sp. CPCC 101110 TaxID=2599619 RepID=UPI0011B560E7|nr:DUF4166 domain-containing protein [Planomicrobium sp. CPCC 101110]TWT26369.1 DUF4166 domain-containing protein [Planomicrobium sp. CPCC 101110]